ncbi:integral membrane sensor signal transduction histidine kinase [Clostridium sp. DL-VIII]|nr:integral membrane sensor signal transduction histidine kinase [Clostridium sp. DL-VIII]
MKKKMIRSLHSLNIKFTLMNILSFFIIAGGIGGIIYSIYINSPAGDINDFNSAFVDTEKFVNRNDDSSEEYLNNVARLYNVNAAVIDIEGKILLKSNNVTEDRFDMDKLYGWFQRKYEDENFYQIYDITIDNKPEKLLIYRKYKQWYKGLDDTEMFWILLAPIIAAMILMFFLINRKVKYIKTMAKGAEEFSSGNLDYRIKRKGNDELGFLAQSMNDMAEKLKENMEKERAQEKFKSELITNVSHDLRTPLTSLIAYLQLTGDEKTSQGNKEKYTDISIEKAYKLKQLIEDLFEYSKLESGGISLNKSEVNVVEILEQSIGELFIEAQKKNMNFKKEFKMSKVILNVDSSKLGRVFENLLSNAVKYGIEGTDIYVNSIDCNEYATIAFKNEMASEISGDILMIFDRFYRGDKSRNSKVSGSGLGLAISKNIVEMHNGEIWAECNSNTFEIYVKIYKS